MMAAIDALELGTRFLLAKQGADGLWRDFLTPAGEASEWPTGFIGAALRLAGAREAPALDRAAETLVCSQNTDGGWGYHEDVPTDADSTACVLLFLSLMGHTGDACRRAASCLVRHQLESGGIPTYREAGPIRRFMGVGRWMRFRGWCSPHSEVTATAGRALASVGFSSEAEAAWRFVRSRQRADGSWSSYWWVSPHYSTLQAVELAVVVGDREPVVRAAEWALRTAGVAAPAFETALALSVLVHGGADRGAVERAVERLAALQDDDGGWSSHPIMRIPLPGVVDPDRPRRVRVRGGIVVQDQHRTFTSAACVAALALAAFDTRPGRY